MATYSDIIVGLSIGAGLPAGLTPRWGGGSFICDVSEEVSAPSGKRLRFGSPSTSERKMVSVDAINDPDRGTIEVLALARCNIDPNSGGSTLITAGGLAARGSGAVGSESVTAGIFGRQSGARIRAGHYSNGSANLNTGSENNIWSQGELVWLLMGVSEASVSLTVYPANDLFGTPRASQTEAANASNSDNWVGVFSFAGNVEFDLLYWSAGTGADNAPLPKPVLSSASGAALSTVSATGSVNTNVLAGVIYAVVTTSATPPSPADIKSGAGAAFSDSQNVTGVGQQDFSATGLSSETTYYWHFLHAHAGVDSDIATSSSFDTPQSAGLVLRNNMPFYDDPDEASLTTDTGITATVTNVSGTLVAFGRYEDVSITAGFFKISDTPFDTENDQFRISLRKGSYSREVDGTVVYD